MALKRTTSAKLPAKAEQKRPAETRSVTLRPVLLADEAPFFYANFVEVGHSNFDFMLLAAKVPTKLSREQRAVVQDTGELELPADLQLVMPPKVAVGLVRALQTQIDAYEKANGPINATKGEKDD